MLESNEAINVLGEKGTYIRRHFTFEDFSGFEVLTQYNLYTKDIRKYIKNRISKAKNILNVFKKLEKEKYSITTVSTVFGKTKCYNTEIGGIFNGNLFTVNVLWNNRPDCWDRGTCIEDGYKQTIYIILY